MEKTPKTSAGSGKRGLGSAVHEQRLALFTLIFAATRPSFRKKERRAVAIRSTQKPPALKLSSSSIHHKPTSKAASV